MILIMYKLKKRELMAEIHRIKKHNKSQITLKNNKIKFNPKRAIQKLIRLEKNWEDKACKEFKVLKLSSYWKCRLKLEIKKQKPAIHTNKRYN